MTCEFGLDQSKVSFKPGVKLFEIFKAAYYQSLLYNQGHQQKAANDLGVSVATIVRFVRDEGLSKPTEGTVERFNITSTAYRPKALAYVLRMFTGVKWVDLGPSCSREEADVHFKSRTEDGTKNTQFSDGVYYKIFHANTVMYFSDRVEKPKKKHHRAFRAKEITPEVLREFYDKNNARKRKRYANTLEEDRKAYLKLQREKFLERRKKWTPEQWENFRNVKNSSKRRRRERDRLQKQRILCGIHGPSADRGEG